MNRIKTYKIQITGLVQGVGFRPFIYRIAHENSMLGTVDNRNDGVLIVAEAEISQLEKFVADISAKAPQAAAIDTVLVEEMDVVGFSDFQIVKSSENADSNTITEISPDIAVCPDCLQDMKRQAHRIDYPFINCTNCGPRFTIIQHLPYDRHQTTMSVFPMCPECEKEYKDVFDRRFHAQPVACTHCGPHYSLETEGEKTENIQQIVQKIAELTDAGKVTAMKGLGGFHLMCDAFDENAVQKLRQLKLRDGKPLAIMCANIETAKEIAEIGLVEEKNLSSWRRPIVLLKAKKSLAAGVQMGFSTIGIMLPYMPFHHLMFGKIKTKAVVLTSGNMSDSPILIDNVLAEESFRNRVDAMLTYNREIFNRTDDSVLFVANEKARLIRRSRGYAPAPVYLGFDADQILATGSELVSTFCIGRGNLAIMSQHIGDLKNAETLEFFEESIQRYTQMFRLKPKLVVCDLHPDYLSTKYALNLEIPVLQVQHHHAHIASVMAEHKLREKVIGLAFDGTGLGTDGNIWGAEFFVCDFADYERYTHFEYLPLPGGDKVTKEPWRTALSMLIQVFGKENFRKKLPLFEKIPAEKIDFIVEMLDKNINCPVSSSMGRIFDGVSALTGICLESAFHAEAPMRLEDAISKDVTEFYSYEINETISLKPMLKEMVKDIENQVEKGIIAAKFHNTIVEIALEVVRKINCEKGLKKVVLSGGSFQNIYLCQQLEARLEAAGFEVFVQEKVPANDGGIALGQLAIAAFQDHKVSQSEAQSFTK